MLDATGALISGAAAIVAGAFAVALVRRYLIRGRVNRALVHWAISLAMFCLAAASLAWGEAYGWSSAWFRAYYLLGGVLVVPWLALGTVEISSRDTVSLRVLGATGLVVAALFLVPVVVTDQPRLFAVGVAFGVLWGLLLLTARGEAVGAGSLALVATFTAIASFVVLAGAITGPVPVEQLPEGSELFPPQVRSFAVGGNALGSTLVVVGAVTAAIRLRGRGIPHLVIGNLLIGLGVLIAASGGLFAFVGETEGHAIAFAVGVTVMYAGFTRTTPAAAPATTAGAPAPVVVDVYTREDCGLCATAERLAAEESGDAEVRLIDIDADPDLQRRYNVRVPVVAVDGEEIAEGRIERGVIAAAVRRATGRVRGG